MQLKVNVKTGKSRSLFKKEGECYIAHLINQPIKGKANKELINLMANYFQVPKSQIMIIKGFKSSIKLVEVIGLNP